MSPAEARSGSLPASRERRSRSRSTLCVVLHYGSEADTWRCVQTLVGVDALDILVADNDPMQNLSVPPRLRGRVEVFRTGGSMGFAQANNMAVRHGRRPYHDTLLLLNNDTLVAADAWIELMAVLCQDRVGAVGPCMPATDREGRIWACGGVIHRFRVSISGRRPPADAAPCEVDYLPGAAVLCMMDVWELVGGLPEKYFLGYEEAEFALRLRGQGYRVMVAPMAIVFHKVGMSSDRQPKYVYNSIRGRIRFGQHLWGRRLGFLLASANTLRETTDLQAGLRIWARAVADEMRGRPLDAAALRAVARQHRRASGSRGLSAARD